MIKFRAKQEPPNINDGELIKLVKNHVFLYDIKSQDYRNLPLRGSIWSNIAYELKISERE